VGMHGGKAIGLAVVLALAGALVAWGVYEHRYGVSPFASGPPSTVRWCGGEYSNDWAGATVEGTATAVSPLPLRKVGNVGSLLGSEYQVFKADGPAARTEAVGKRVCPMSVYLRTGPNHYVRYDIPA
jgi:hypothetical protein